MRALPFFLFLLSAVESNFGIPIEDASGVVRTSNGRIRGKLLHTEHSVPFWAFLEVPYATPPVAELRMLRPLPPKDWEGVLNATENTKICWEIRNKKKVNDPRESEDCLYLNVYVPKEPKTRGPLPVVVYFTGGAYNFNDGTFKSYKPNVFVEEDVISVFTNFRQGVFGFLSTGDNVIRGNNGLWDQRMSLLWVQKNIANFGGDPEKVAIMGHSSGASCVTAHTFSKKSTGLFSRAVVESAGLLGNIETDPGYFAFKLGAALSSDFTAKNSSKDLLRLLNTLPPSVIVNTTYEFDQSHNHSFYHGLWMPFRIVVENADDDDTFISKHVYENIVKGEINKVPLLIGVTSEEDIMFRHDRKSTAMFLDQDPAVITRGNDFARDEDRVAMGEELKALYTNETLAKNETAFIKLLGDLEFGFRTILEAYLHSYHADVYFYKFSYFGPMNLQKPLKYKWAGLAGHCAELAYLVYYHLDGDTTEYPPSDLLTRKRLGRMFTNFIKYSNPTPQKEALLQNVTWPKFNAEEQLFLDIDYDLVVRSRPNSFFEKWVAIVKKYSESPTKLRI